MKERNVLRNRPKKVIDDGTAVQRRSMNLTGAEHAHPSQNSNLSVGFWSTAALGPPHTLWESRGLRLFGGPRAPEAPVCSSTSRRFDRSPRSPLLIHLALRLCILQRNYRQG
jgi:hypothetical protein